MSWTPPETPEFFSWLRANNARVWREGAESAFYDPEVRDLVDYPDNPYESEGVA